jgi:hypothetical protein
MTSAQFTEPFLRESFQDPLKQTEPQPTLWGNPECFAVLLLNIRRRVAAAIVLAGSFSAASHELWNAKRRFIRSCRLLARTLGRLPQGKELYARI